MDIPEVIEQIKDHVNKNNGEWDLTNDNGEPMIYCDEKEVHIPDLAVNKDGEVCALVPLGYFSDETVCNILDKM
mgnify:CR=1 FL=1